MFDGYVDWFYESMMLGSKVDFAACLEHAYASMGEDTARAAFEEARELMVN